MTELIRQIAIIVFLSAVFTPSNATFVVKVESPLGEQPVVVKPQGGLIQLYTASVALVVSVSNYKAGASGWTKLDNTGNELDKVSLELRKQGFEVTRVYDPSTADLRRVLDDFLAKYGGGQDIRVLFFFSGHGFTSEINQMSYVVLADGVNPKTDYSGFLGRSVALESFHTWVRQFSAKHVLAIFDTCFSGAIFTLKSISKDYSGRPVMQADRWKYLTSSVIKPVRQFISAGGANEELPSSSTFVPVFIEAIRGGASSVDDGFVTGKEVGVFVERVVSERRNGEQNPMSGVSRDTNYIFGDMVFQPDRSKANRNATVVASPRPQRVEQAVNSTTPAALPARSAAQNCFTFNEQTYCD